MDGYELKVRIDLESWAVNGRCDLMGSSDFMVDMSSVVVVVLLALSVTSFESPHLSIQSCVLCVCVRLHSATSVVTSGTVRGQPLSVCVIC